MPNYYITRDGRVFSKQVKNDLRQLSPNLTTAGYYAVHFYHNKVRKTRAVHRLVAEHFLDSWESTLQVNHKDGDKLNNHISNLEMCSPKENIAHALAFGRLSTGEKHYNTKLTWEDINIIRSLKGFYQKQLGAIFGVGQSCIYKILRNLTWKKY